jgi:branched-chain amino acid transport system permease protein
MSKRVELTKTLGYSALIAVLFLIPLFIKGPYTFHILITIGMNIILATSLRLILNSGQLSLAHGGMMGVGAYTSALLVMKLGVSSWAALLLSGMAAAGLACIVGFPFVRLRGIYFAIITIFLGQMIILTGEQWESLTGGSLGILNIPRPNPIIIPGLLNMDFHSKVDFYYFILILTLITLFILHGLENSRITLTWRSIQQADFLAESVGVNTAKFKVLAFSLGCFFAGIVGGFYSHYIRVVSPRTFDLSFAIYVMVYMVAGGMDKFSGPIFGVFVLIILTELFRNLKEFQPFVFAGVLMLIIFFLPEGLVGLTARLKKLLKVRLSHA